MADRIVTVFGGTGFLGRHAVRHLLGQRLVVRIASRHPERAPSLEGSTLQSIRADINGEAAVAAAVAGAYGVVNAVSLYRERGTETFHALHVEAAGRLARHAQRAGVERFVHVSGIGADAASSSLYIRSRGEGELAVQAAFANAIIVRPAVMFGEDDAFLNTLVTLLKRLPGLPHVWAWPDTAAARLCRGCGRGHSALPAAGRCESGHVRTWRTAGLYLRGAAQGGCGPAWQKAHLVFRAISHLALAGPDHGEAARGTAKPLSSGPHEDRHHRLCTDARVCRPRHRATAHRSRARTNSCKGLEAASPRPIDYARGLVSSSPEAPGLVRRSEPATWDKSGFGCSSKSAPALALRPQNRSQSSKPPS